WLQRRSRDDAGRRGSAGARRHRRPRGHRTGAGHGRLHGAAPVHGFHPWQRLRAVGVAPRGRDHLQHRRGPWRRRRVRAGLRRLPRADHRHVEARGVAVPLSYNVRSLYIRRKLTMLEVGGIALVIAVLIVLMAMANGFRVALSATGSPINAIVTQRGSNSELGSAITRDSAQFLSDDPRVMKDADGRALLSPELVVEGMAIGRSFTLQRRDWMIVGVFDAGGSGFESEIWGDVDVIGPAFNRGGY